MTMTIVSPAFVHNQAIPVRFTADGADVSPPLTWSGAPAGAREFALIVDDPDAPGDEPWVHWVIYKIPADRAGWPEGVAKVKAPGDPAGAVQGKNSFGKIGYGGPSPPRGHGVHHYHFQLYALKASLNLTDSLTKQQLLAAIQGQVMAQAELVGTYVR